MSDAMSFVALTALVLKSLMLMSRIWPKRGRIVSDGNGGGKASCGDEELLYSDWGAALGDVQSLLILRCRSVM